MRAYRLTVALAVVTLVACAAPAQEHHDTARSRTSSKSTTASATVALVPETPAPVRPPTVDVVVRSHGRTSVQRAGLLRADFRMLRPPTVMAPLDPVPWPKPLRVDADAKIAVSFATSTPPDELMVRSWPKLVPGERALPVPVLSAEFDCQRFAARPCAVTRHRDRVQLVVDPKVLAGTYLAVFGTWHVPVTQRSGADAPDDATATWVFRVVRSPRVEASRS